MSETAPRPSPRRYSLAHLVLVLPWIALVIDAFAPIRDNSFLWHIRAGELQATDGVVLQADPFSFTKFGEPWLTQSWLAELLYASGEEASGLGFVPPMMLVTTTVTFVALGLIAYRRSGSVPVTALVLVLSTVLLISFLVPRPVLFSFALFALVILAWDRPSSRWAIPLLFWIWASVHGSFVIGLGYVGLSILMEREWKALPTAILSGLLTLLTAHGLGVLGILIDFSQAGDTLALLTEWRRPEPLSAVFTPFIIGIALIVLGAFRGKITPKHLWLIVPFLALGLSSTRAVPPAWIGIVPLVALSLEGLGADARRRFPAGIAVVFTAFVLVFPFFVAGDADLDDEHFPIAASAVLDEVNTFHDDRTGGYLIWADGPERLVFIDDRAELYRERMAEFVAVRSGEEPWEPVFERDGIEQVLMRADESLLDDLRASGWGEVYADDNYVVLSP